MVLLFYHLAQSLTSTVYWCIASKLKVPIFFFMKWTTRFCVLIYQCSISLTLAVLQRQKSLPDIGSTNYMSAAWLPWDSQWSLASTPWAMNLYFKFRAIYFWLLTHWGRDKMAAFSQTTFSNAFSSMKMFEFRLQFHWSLFLWFELTILRHWFR